MALEGICLVARAIPLKDASAEQEKGPIDGLAEHLDSLSLSSRQQKKHETAEKKGEERKKMREEATISPADHLALQSLRSSALARKTNTTTKLTRDCRKLFADLMMMGEEKEKKTKMGEKNGTKKNENEEEKKSSFENKLKEGEKAVDSAEGEGKESADGDQLLSRGPIRVPPGMIGRGELSIYHPYSAAAAVHPNVYTPPNEFMSSTVSFNATALQSTVFDQSSYNSMASAGYSYECGLPSNWSCGGASAGRDSVFSSPSTTPDTVSMMSPPGDRGEKVGRERSELPDDLSDFILEYSRRYSPELSRKCSLGSQGLSGGSPQSDSSTDEDRFSQSSGNSPLCAHQSSPAAPRGGVTTNDQYPQQFITGTSKGGGAFLAESPRPVKERLRAMISSEEMDDAWAWTCKCIQRHPMALNFQDGDGDTLLHIVMGHLDFAKIYALVEQMLKSEAALQNPLLFDVPNKMETGVHSLSVHPLLLLYSHLLMVAVHKGQIELVDYLLEAGASPNSQSCRLQRDTPLHYASAHGMTRIVTILCSHPSIALNAQNGSGLTPLLAAFKTHMNRIEETQSQMDNCGAIEALLRSGADVGLSDSTSGRTLVHYAVEKMDLQLIELLRSNVDEHRMAKLVDQKDFCGDTPMNNLRGMSGDHVDESQKAKMCLALITCGANAY